jgi:putative ABC transport system ATP-binding protein
VTLYDVKGAARFFQRGGAVVRAVDGVDLIIESGDVVALEGPSGSGKTTLLQLLGALDRASEGTVMFEGQDLGTQSDGALAELRLRTFGFVFQQFNLIPTLTALDNVVAALAPMGISDSEAQAKAGAVLAEVGLEERGSHLPPQLSGGEQQRVAIARALVKDPRVVLADEPTGNLDSQTGKEIIALLTRSAEGRGATVIVATHDAELAALARRRLHMRDGMIPNGASHHS